MMQIGKRDAATLLAWFRRYEGETEADSGSWALAVQLMHISGYHPQEIKRTEQKLLEALRAEAQEQY